VFVFRLMFRLYWLPRKLSDNAARSVGNANASALFYQRKRLLSTFAARKYPLKVRRDGETVEYTKYLMISALAMDTSPSACRALNGMHCSIYDRRPLSCRSVPFHYSHAEASAETGLRSFVETPGYRCDTGDTAEVVLEDGRIVAPEIKVARSEAIAVAARDLRWREAIVRRMNTASLADLPLPTLEEIDAGANLGVTTTSMRVAWQIAADVGLIAPEECERLIKLQLCVINEELADGSCPQDARETLIEMQAQDRLHLHGRHASAANA
jgi:Fe-S-cluster containining protein